MIQIPQHHQLRMLPPHDSVVSTLSAVKFNGFFKKFKVKFNSKKVKFNGKK